jgi:hypothetical protein
MSNQNRVPSGVPTGGEFAAVSHAEAGIALADPAARPGTFGSEFVDRLIREQVANPASVEDRLAPVPAPCA